MPELTEPDLIDGLSTTLHQHDWRQQGQTSVTQLDANSSQEAMSVARAQNMLLLTTVRCLCRWNHFTGCSMTWSATALASVNLPA